MKRVSLPHEHGGYLTVGGGTIVALALAPDARAPLFAAVTILAGFFARGPLEALAVRGKAAPWDGPLLALLLGLAAVATSGAALHVGLRSVPAALLAGATIAGSVFARWQRDHRSAWFEVAGMASLGAGAGALLWAGGATMHTALAVALAMGANAAIAVPLVRSELRPRERANRATADRYALGLLLFACVALVGLGAPRAILALVPRALQLAVRQWPSSSTTSERPRAAAIGLRETGILLVAALALIGVLR